MSGGGSDVGKDAAQAQAKSSRELFEGSRPARDAFLKQVMAAMAGKPGQVPIINTATEGANFGRENALKDTASIVNKLGFSQQAGRAISAPLDTKGRQNTSGVREQLLKQFRAYGPGLAIQPAQLAQSGLAGAVQRGQANAAADKAADNQAAASGGAAAAAIASAIIIAAAQSSSAAVKTDIERLDTVTVEAAAEKIGELQPATYRYLGQSDLRFGLIIEDLPPEIARFVVTNDGGQVDLYSLATLALTGLKVQTAKLVKLEERLAKLENVHA